MFLWNISSASGNLLWPQVSMVTLCGQPLIQTKGILVLKSIFSLNCVKFFKVAYYFQGYTCLFYGDSPLIKSLKDQFWVLFFPWFILTIQLIAYYKMQNCLQMIHLYFRLIHDVDTSANKLINKQDFHWKMSFNPDPSKQSQEIIFSRKTKKVPHLSLRFNNNIVS